MSNVSRNNQQASSSGGGIFNSLKSMVNDFTGGSSSTPQQHQQQPKKTSSSSLFPSLSVIQTNLPQEIQRVRGVLQNPSVSLNQLEQGERSLDELISVLSGQLAELCEMRRENSQRLITRLKQSSGNTTTNVQQQQQPQTNSVPPKQTQPTVKAPTTQKVVTPPGFGALATRSASRSPQPQIQASSTAPSSLGVESLDSILIWQENEESNKEVLSTPNDPFSNNEPTKVATPVEILPTFEIPLVGATANVSPSQNEYHAPPGLDSLLDEPSVSDVISAPEKNTKKDNDFNLDQILGTTTQSEPVGDMLDFSNEGQKALQSNQILSMFDNKDSNSDAVVGATIDMEVQDNTTANKIDDFDF